MRIDTAATAERSPAAQPALPARQCDSPLTIAHVITRFVRGGADENTLLSCNAQAAAGHRVTLVFGNDRSVEMCARLDARVRQVCVPALVRHIDPPRDARALLELLRLFTQLKPQIVHTHTSKAGVIGRLAAYLADADAVVHGVHILPFVNVGRIERTAYLALERLLDPLTDAFVSVSADLRDTCLAEQVGAPAAHAVIASGMDIGRFRHAAPLSRAEILHAFGRSGRADTLQLVVMVAALEPRKRVVEFLRVFKSVVERRPDTVLAVLGEGIDRLRALDQADALGVGDHVRLVGYCDDVERWIAAADVCVLASEREGLPRAVVQYALAARPIVVSELPGIDAIVRDGKNGFVTDAEDLDEMCDPIVRLLSEPALAGAFSEYARGMNLSAWSVDNMTVELDHVYARALDAPRQRRTAGGTAWIL